MSGKISKIDLMFQKPKKTNISRPKASVDQKPSFFLKPKRRASIWTLFWRAEQPPISHMDPIRPKNVFWEIKKEILEPRLVIAHIMWIGVRGYRDLTPDIWKFNPWHIKMNPWHMGIYGKYVENIYIFWKTTTFFENM